ncbi:MAG: hypothetical protein ACREDH_06585 [Methylocella sp.]
MDLRQRFFAMAPQFPGAANLFDDATGNSFAMGGGQEGKKARLVAIEGETARQPLLLEGHKQRAAPEHEASLAKCQRAMKGAD